MTHTKTYRKFSSCMGCCTFSLSLAFHTTHISGLSDRVAAASTHFSLDFQASDSLLPFFSLHRSSGGGGGLGVGVGVDFPAGAAVRCAWLLVVVALLPVLLLLLAGERRGRGMKRKENRERGRESWAACGGLLTLQRKDRLRIARAQNERGHERGREGEREEGGRRERNRERGERGKFLRNALSQRSLWKPGKEKSTGWKSTTHQINQISKPNI